jgi:glutaredoxin
MEKSMKLIRWLLGRLILTIDFLTRPKSLVREEGAQDTIDALTENLSIYQFSACPFCVKVRRQLRKNALNIELRDAKNNAMYKDELTKQGGKYKVPCLRIESDSGDTKWLYESDSIISYLQKELLPTPN